MNGNERERPSDFLSLTFPFHSGLLVNTVKGEKRAGGVSEKWEREASDMRS